MSRCSPVVCARTFAAATFVTMVASAFADDGMWTFDHPPVDLVKQRYGVALKLEM